MKKVMKYYTPELTPLKFHKFYHWIMTPVNILYTLYIIWTMFAENTISPLLLAYDLLLIVSCVLTFVGCFNFRKYAWWAIMGGFALELFYDIYVIAFYAIQLPEYVLVALNMQGWRFIIIIFLAVYYWKRKPLFFNPVPLEQIPKEYRK